MISLSVDINWWALLQVTVVTIVVSVLIAALMSLANWFFSGTGASEEPTATRKVAGYIMLGIIGLLVLFGLYLMIPYFHHG
ncbi:MAG: hypothetical protein LBV00_08940 [Propionibacteriaceae bacterium]|jgi:hypothetical protein|nr:hypothetical protein [Propionibacteriaceae bacterium]